MTGLGVCKKSDMEEAWVFVDDDGGIDP